VTANLSPLFTAKANATAPASLSAAETSRTAPTNAVAVVTAGADGTMISRVHVHATGTTTAGMIRLFLHDGAAYHLREEIPVAAVTPSGVLPAFSADSTVFTPATPVTIPAGWSLRAATHNAEAFQVVGEAGDFS
jgi:hypothetical protein